ncbi:MAG: DUF4859 domain-containing protein [Bacteroidota bacterium]|nr:DUF4859 domain-containing protein [Bacteroidota bacterium]
MRIATLKFKQLFVAGLCAFSLSANAQYSATLEQDANKDYSSVAATFKLTDVAATLGTDTATLGAALEAWQKNAPTDDASKLFVVVNPDATTSGNYTGNYGEFWLSGSGSPVAYSIGSWFAGNSWDVAADEYNIYAGQFPDSLNEGGTVHGKFALVYGGKQATFDITLNVLKLPEAPSAEVQISKLKIVGEAVAEVTQYPRSGYDTDALYANIADAAEKLGTDKVTLSRIMANITYQPKIDETYGMMADSVVLVTTNGGWARRALSNLGDTLHACGNAPWSKNDAMYIQNIAYNATSDTISADVGQYPNALQPGDSIYTDIYLIYGSNAYKVRFTLKIVEAPYHGLEDMINVGDSIITIEQELNDSYLTTAIYPNVQTIAAALNTTTTNLSLQGIDSNGGLSSNSTANNGGYWMTKGGTITSWGTGAAFFVEPVAEGDYSTLNVGQFPQGLAEGDTAKCVLYFVSGSNYYTLHFNLVIKKSTVIDPTSFVNVATKNGTIQQLKNDGYTWSDTNNTGTTFTIPVAQINELLDTTTPTFYALEQDTAVAAGAAKYTKRYTCTPYPGFWVSKNGQNMGWSSATRSPWGIGFAIEGNNGVIKCMQYPNSSNPGDVYTGQFFLINEENNKMITLNITYQIVQTLENVEVVGTSDIVIPVTMTQDSQVPIDLDAIAKTLGLDGAQTLLTGGYYLKGLQENGLYSAGVDPINGGLMFDRQGYNNPLGVFGFVFNSLGTSITSFSNEEIQSGFTANGTICFQVDSKRYVVNVTFMNASDYSTGVKNVEGNAKNVGIVYDLSGRQVKTTTKGIYIRSGKKFVIK